MRRSLLPYVLAGASCVFATAALGQVAGVGYTLAPRAGYLFPSDNSGLQNQFAIGADFGFSFGQFIELRANYIQGIGGATDLERLGEELINSGTLPDSRDVNVRRIGGDVKFNLGKGAFLPYLLIGTGIQTLELEDDVTNLKNENIYGNAGLGFVLSAADRYTFFVEGRYLQYRNNAFQALVTDAERVNIRTNAGDPVNFNSGTRRVGNYSIEAGAAFYLGGRRPGEMTELDRAYAAQFGDGFRGASLEIEPTLSRINFDGALPFRDTWLGGVALGFNFGPLVGIRGYYLRGMQDDEINLDFDNFSVYGVDMRFNLNTSQTGIAPFLTLGGGLIDPRDGYLGVDDVFEPSSQGFASGGGGLVLGLSRTIKLRATYKALLTSASELDADELVTTDQITTSNQFSIGLDFAIGRKARDGNQILADREAEAAAAQRERDLTQRDSILAQRDSLLAQQREANDAARDSLRQSFEAELAQREAALNAALAARDTAVVDSLQALVETTENLLEEIEETDAKADQRNVAIDERRMRGEMRTVMPDGSVRVTREDTIRMEDGSLRIEREVEIERPNLMQSQRSGGSSGGTIRMSVAEFEGLIEEMFESSLPMGPEAFAVPRSANPQGFGPESGYRFDPMTGEPLPVSAAEQARRENEILREELRQMRRDIDALRGVQSAPATVPARVAPNPSTSPAAPRQVAPQPATAPAQPTTPTGATGAAPLTEDEGATVLDEVGIREEEAGEKAPQADGDGVTILDEVGIREEEPVDERVRNTMPDTTGVVQIGTPEPEPREETRKERKAREKAERKAEKAREKAAKNPN